MDKTCVNMFIYNRFNSSGGQYKGPSRSYELVTCSQQMINYAISNRCNCISTLFACLRTPEFSPEKLEEVSEESQVQASLFKLLHLGPRPRLIEDDGWLFFPFWLDKLCTQLY